jgi:HEAT repeat protein
MTVRLHALKGLARKKHKKSWKAITFLLKDESGGIRVNAIYALIKLKEKRALSKIEKCLSDQKSYVRLAAQDALSIISR